MNRSSHIRMFRLLSWFPIAMMSAALGILAVFTAFSATSTYEGLRTVEYGGLIAALVFAILAVGVWPSIGDRLPSRLRSAARATPGAFFIILAIFGTTFSLQPSDPNDGSDYSLVLPVSILGLVFAAIYFIAAHTRSKTGNSDVLTADGAEATNESRST